MNCKKVYFATEDYALMYIDKLKKTSKRSVIPVRAYLCEKCLLWHLTSKNDQHIKHLQKHILKLKTRIEYLEKKLSNK